MKKYLMTGIAAVALCAAFTSCSHDSDGFSTLQEAKEAEYAVAFEKAYGKISSTQDWGFGSARTRAHDDGRIDVNGNEWKSKPEVTAAEARAVFDYVNRVKTSIPYYSETAPDNLSTYYCTQVWGGDNKVESDVADERTYPNYDQKQRGEAGNVYGPEKMNELAIAMSLNKGPIGIDDNGKLVGDWSHINNFNASKNTNFGGNTGVIGGGTLDFAYKSSEDSKYHNKWIIIDGQYITDADGVNHAGKYYVCFDFISCKDGVYTNFQKPGVGNVTVKGAYATVAEAIAAKAKDSNGDLVQSDWQIGNVTGGNMCIPANDIYTDWIIRLVNAQPVEDPVVESGRIFCEDLGSIGDFDFNDVVFDAFIYQSGKIHIDVLAAGGTLPMKVANHDIVAGMKNNVQKKMVNTGLDTAPVYSFDIPAKAENVPEYASLKDIPVVVTQKVNQYDQDIMLKAETGAAPQKICLPVGTKWVDEYVDINAAYPNFENWVGQKEGITSPVQAVGTRVDKFVDLILSNNAPYRTK